MILIRTKPQSRYATAILRDGLQDVVSQAWTRTGECARSQKWLLRLWEDDVIVTWTFEVDGHVFDLEDPDTGAPLFLPGPAWPQFLAECHRLKLTSVETRRE